MAGSLNHITLGDGTCTMDGIENLGDAYEALEECHQIIAALLRELAPTTRKRQAVLERICNAMAFPVPVVPVLQRELWGHESNRSGKL